MYEYWDSSKFQQRNPHNFNVLGNQFIADIISNIQQILDFFNNQQFLKATPSLLEISIKSLQFDAKKLSNCADELEKYTSQYQQINEENILILNAQFQLAQKQQSAKLLLRLIEIAQGTQRDWYKSQYQEIKIEQFQEKVELLRHIFSLQASQNCCSFCQII